MKGRIKFERCLLAIFLMNISLSFNLIYSQIDSTKSEIKNDILLPIFNEGDINTYITNHIKYPRTSLARNEQGYVFVSFLIDKEGDIKNITKLVSPSAVLTDVVINALQQTNKMWNPTIQNGEAVEKKYKAAVKFKIIAKTNSPGYFQKGLKLMEKEKYDKALKYFNSSIEYNKFFPKAYLKRSEVKSLLGDIKGAAEDLKTYRNYKNQFLISLTITAKALSSNTVIFDTKRQ